MGGECSTCHQFILLPSDCCECRKPFCHKCQPLLPCTTCRTKLNLDPTCPSCQTSRSEVHLWPCKKCHQYTMCSNCHNRHQNICLACAHTDVENPVDFRIFGEDKTGVLSSPKMTLCYCGEAACEQCGVKCIDCQQIIHQKCIRSCCQQPRCLQCDYQHQRCICGVVTNEKTCARCKHHICSQCSTQFVCSSSGWPNNGSYQIKCSAKRELCHSCFKGCECPDRKFYCEHHQRKCAICQNRTLGSHVSTIEYQCELCKLPWKIQTCCHHTPQDHLQLTDLYCSPTGHLRCPKHVGECKWHHEPTIPEEPCIKCIEASDYVRTNFETLPPPLRRIIAEY
jgi:hypothetical protein